MGVWVPRVYELWYVYARIRLAGGGCGIVCCESVGCVRAVSGGAGVERWMRGEGGVVSSLACGARGEGGGWGSVVVGG